MRLNIDNATLFDQCTNWISSLCESGGRSWTLSIPVNGKDPDMLFSELINRCKDTIQENVRIQGDLNDAIDLLDECRLQLEYLSNKFGQTGTTENVLGRINTFIKS